MNVWIWRPLGHLERQMGQLLDFTLDLVNRHGEPSWRSLASDVHACNLYETPTEYQILLPLPGVKADEVDLQVVGHRLDLQGHRKRPDAIPDEHYRRQERWFGGWSRSVELPDRADTSQVTASLENGLLLIRVPKKPEAKAKQFPVKIAKGHANSAPALVTRSALHGTSSDAAG
jgi:HSP20 family protein